MLVEGRYCDLVLGLVILLSHLVLSYGVVQERRGALTLHLILCTAVLVLYWGHLAYLKYGVQDVGEASKEVILSTVLTRLDTGMLSLIPTTHLH